MNLALLFAPGRLVDLVLAVVVVEFVVLAWRDRGRGLFGALADPFFALAPGACLLLALRAAISGDTGAWILIWLTASLPAHLADLARRGRRR